VVNASKAVVRLAEGQGNVEQVIDTRGNALLTWAKALRFHQWMKNLLVFAPLLAAHQVGDLDLAAGHLHFLRLRPVRVQRLCAERPARSARRPPSPHQAQPALCGRPAVGVCRAGGGAAVADRGLWRRAWLLPWKFTPRWPAITCSPWRIRWCSSA
jgi:hypothetical protein